MPARTLDVATVREVDPPLRPEAPNDDWKIVLRVGGERSAAKGDAVREIVDDPGDALERRSAGDNAWQSKYRPRWIIRMQRHSHSGRCGDRNDALQEVRKVVPEFVLIHRAIRVEKFLEFVGAIGRRPTGQVGRSAREIDLRERVVIERERGRAVVEPAREVCAHPIEYRHEVVAEHRHARAPHVADALAVVVDEAVARGAADLDVLVDGNALDDRQRHAVLLDIFAQRRDAIQRPRLSHRNVEERTNDAAHSWYLSDVRERNRVARSEPAKRDHPAATFLALP